jgi:serine/threonine-protein kinase RsbW
VEADLLSIEVSNDVAVMPLVAAKIEKFCTGHGIAHRDINRFTLALEEVLTNAIAYGFPDGGRHRIAVEVRHAGGTLHATVSDDGLPFDPLAEAAPDLTAPIEQRRVGGLGIHLLRELTEARTYTRDNGRNVLSFRLRIGRPRVPRD